MEREQGMIKGANEVCVGHPFKPNSLQSLRLSHLCHLDFVPPHHTARAALAIPRVSHYATKPSPCFHRILDPNNDFLRNILLTHFLNRCSPLALRARSRLNPLCKLIPLGKEITNPATRSQSTTASEQAGGIWSRQIPRSPILARSLYRTNGSMFGSLISDAFRISQFLDTLAPAAYACICTTPIIYPCFSILLFLLHVHVCLGNENDGFDCLSFVIYVLYRACFTSKFRSPHTRVFRF